jgi:hypothetical protein
MRLAESDESGCPNPQQELQARSQRMRFNLFFEPVDGGNLQAQFPEIQIADSRSEMRIDAAVQPGHLNVAKSLLPKGFLGLFWLNGREEVY